MSAFWGCNNDLAPIRQNQALPPDLSKHSVFESFSPDSGGIGTQLIIRGKNFGSDPSYVKVTVNKMCIRDRYNTAPPINNRCLNEKCVFMNK